MVPRSPRQQIASIVAIALMLGAAFYFRTAHVAESYSLNDQAFNLSVADGIKGAKNATTTSAKAVIVPHHLVASRSIALGIKVIAKDNPKTIILISPDHYGKCERIMCVAENTYTTLFGEVPTDPRIVQELLTSALVATSSLFKDEHGIYTIMPFIKYYLPDTSVISLVISQKTKGDEELRKSMIDLLKPYLSDPKTSLVISSDFSHYLPIEETKKKDALTQESFCKGDVKEIIALENPSQSDCPLCLFIAAEEAKELGFWNPNLLSHTNSGELLHDEKEKELTSHFVFALSKDPASTSCPLIGGAPPKNENNVTLLFVGDMMFDRYIRQMSDRHGSDYVFSCVDSLLKDPDLVIGNLEGPVTGNQSTSVGTAIGSADNYRFTFPIDVGKRLKDHHIGLVNIGNNHITDHGTQGLLSTEKNLRDAGVGYFGGIAGNSSIFRTTIRGINFSFVNYNEFGGESKDMVIKKIEDEHINGRKVIVYTHWGVEYVSETETMKELAQEFKNAGADIIIGSHPHVIEDHELLGTTPVYYSLGNFIFDQYFDPRTMEGLSLRVTFSKDGIVNMEEQKVDLMKDGRTCVQK